MFILPTLIALNNKLVAYDFISNSGISDTGGKAGYSAQTSMYDIIGSAVGILVSVVGVIFLGFIIYGAIMWMAAEGKEERIEKAKKIIIESLYGLVIILAAYAISYFVINALSK